MGIPTVSIILAYCLEIFSILNPFLNPLPWGIPIMMPNHLRQGLPLKKSEQCYAVKLARGWELQNRGQQECLGLGWVWRGSWELPDSSRTNVPLICQSAMMSIFQGWHLPLPVVLLLACLEEDKCSLYPWNADGPCHRAYNKQIPKLWLWTKLDYGSWFNNTVVYVSRSFHIPVES